MFQIYVKEMRTNISYYKASVNEVSLSVIVTITQFWFWFTVGAKDCEGKKKYQRELTYLRH